MKNFNLTDEDIKMVRSARAYIKFKKLVSHNPKIEEALYEWLGKDKDSHIEEYAQLLDKYSQSLPFAFANMKLMAKHYEEVHKDKDVPCSEECCGSLEDAKSNMKKVFDFTMEHLEKKMAQD